MIQIVFRTTVLQASVILGLFSINMLTLLPSFTLGSMLVFPIIKTLQNLNRTLLLYSSCYLISPMSITKFTNIEYPIQLYCWSWRERTDPQPPKRSFEAPNTTLATPICAMADAHIMHGSIVTYLTIMHCNIYHSVLPWNTETSFLFDLSTEEIAIISAWRVAYVWL